MPTVFADQDIKDEIRKLDFLLDEAQKVGIKKIDLEPCWKAIGESLPLYEANKFDDAYIVLMKAKATLGDLTASLPVLKKSDFLARIYGTYPLAYGIVWLIVSAFLLLYWPPANFPLPVTTFGTPAWASFLGGIGASVQIVVSVAGDVQSDGYVQENRRDWWIVLPFVGLVFGFVAYLLFQVGLISVTTGSTSSAATSQTLLPVICFLSGYSTNWFIKQLNKLAT